tara:strand:- start:75 stop:656 length:582 start_codon:yes stop_codon:yes gene_type:complete
MDNCVRIYDGVMTDEKCQYFVDKFEAHPEMQELQNNSHGKTLTMMSLMDNPDGHHFSFKEDLIFLNDMFMENVEKYKKDLDLKSYQFPNEFGIEAFKIKRYLPNTTDEFPAHIDVHNYAQARRFLIMFVYLTDDVAGQTELEMASPYGLFDMISSPCRRGSILMFPPMWPWVHAGKAPAENSKYIIGSYLHYI